MKIRYLLLLPFFVLSCSPKKSEPGAVKVATKTVPETLFLCLAEEVTQEEMPAFAQRAIGPLYETLSKLGQPPAGDLEFICQKWSETAAKNKVVFALPIAKEVSVDAPYYLWKAPAFKCAWTEYQGAMSGIKDAWMKFGGEVEQSGHQAAAWREVYVHWVAPDSAEDRTELQMGIE